MPRGFANALRAVDTTTDIGVIAEVKKPRLPKVSFVKISTP